MALPGGVSDMAPSVALDAGALHELNRQARTAPQHALRAAASQFEALFLQNLMKGMRESMPQDGPLDSDTSRTYTEMLDAQMAQALAKKGTGIADMLVKQLERSVGTDASATGAPDAAGAAASTGVPAVPAQTVDATLNLLKPQALPLTPKRYPLAHTPALHPLTPAGKGAALKAFALHAASSAQVPAMTSTARASTSSTTTVATTVSTPAATVTQRIQAAAAARVQTAPAPAHSRSLAASVSSTVAHFVDTMKPYAEMAAQALGVPVHYLVAQAGLETGWGKSQPRGADGTPSHNLFGIKAGRNWKGAVVEAPTTEYVGGRPVRTVERFRAYTSPREAFADFASMLSHGNRYAAALGSGTAEGYATQMQRAGYATDPAYGDKLARVIRTVALHSDSAQHQRMAQVTAGDADNASTVG